MKTIFHMVCDIDLVSVNNKYCNRSYTLTEKYRTYKKNMSDLAAFHYRGKAPSDSMLHVEIYAATGKDLDNIIKPTFDALEGIVFGNDTQICRIDIQRIAKVNKHERIEIKISEVNK